MRESIVLLKNEKNLLPLSASKLKKILVTGPNATETNHAKNRYGPKMTAVVTPLAGLQAKLAGKVDVVYEKGCDLTNPGWPKTELYPTPLSKKEKAAIAKAVAAAKTVDVIVAFVGGSSKTCGEARSRTSLDLPGRQRELLQALHATGKPLVVVMISGRPLSINWTKDHVPAILAAWYPGGHGGTAIADVLLGDYNPGGRLTVTFPKTVGQIPMHFPAKPNSQIDGSSYGARVNGILWPFGYGLSYTKFEYSNLKITPDVAKVGSPITVSCDVKNVGTRAGDEVVQLYLQDRYSSVTTYEKNLRGFERLSLKPGETKRVSFTILPKHMQLLNREMKWVVEPGEFRVFVGGDSVTPKLTGKFVQADEKVFAELKAVQSKKTRLAKFITASNHQPGNLPVYAIDGDENTRFASEVKGVQLDVLLPKAQKVSEVQIAWYRPKRSRQYTFEIQLETGGGYWVTVAKGKSDTSREMVETYKFKPTTTSAIRIIGKGNNVNTYTSITEIRIPGVKFE